MANPIFNNEKAFKKSVTSTAPAPDPEQLQAQFDAPSATAVHTGRMSYEGVIAKTASLLILLGATAAIGFLFPNMALVIGAAIVGLVLVLVIAFKKPLSAPLIAVYAAVEGYFLGGITTWIETAYEVPGAGLQALIATGLTFAVCLGLYRSGKVRYTSKLRKILIIGGSAYALFSLVNIGLMLFTDIGGWGMRTEVEIFGIPLGVLIGVFAIFLACIALIADFDFIENGVKRGLPAAWDWRGAFGLVVTLVWLYIEFLRLIAILFGRR